MREHDHEGDSGFRPRGDRVEQPDHDLVGRAAASEEYATDARRGVEAILGEFYRSVGWRVSVRWK